MINDARPHIMVTGHRDLPADQNAWVESELRRITEKLIKERGEFVALGGVALGVDTQWAQTALDMSLPVWSYVPFPGQARRWPRPNQVERQGILDRSERVVTVQPAEITERSAVVRALHARNDAMLNAVNAGGAVVAVLDIRGTGGTFSAVRKAIARSLPILRVNPTTRSTSWIHLLR